MRLNKEQLDIFEDLLRERIAKGNDRFGTYTRILDEIERKWCVLIMTHESEAIYDFWYSTREEAEEGAKAMSKCKRENDDYFVILEKKGELI